MVLDANIEQESQPVSKKLLQMCMSPYYHFLVFFLFCFL